MSKSGKNQTQSLRKKEQLQRQANGWSKNQSSLYEYNGTSAVKEDTITNSCNNSKQLNSRVTFSAESVAIEETEIPSQSGEEGVGEHILHVEDENRESWDNKAQFFLGVISYAVGFGNIWRFPALLQKNGGGFVLSNLIKVFTFLGAFLIPYLLMMFFEGIPLFLIELGIGQRLQTGPVGVWNAIHPYLGGVGVSGAIVSYFVGLYYNVILTWVLYYAFKSIRIILPWSSCPTHTNGTIVEECAKSSSPTNFFWNRVAIDTSSSIGEAGGFATHITITLVFAWILIYLCVMRGIKSSGKVMYLTATFPYIVTTIFLIRSLALEGATDGLLYMLHPDLSRLYDPEVWLEAATQIFYSMGLGFGGLIAFASYLPLKNNCKRDCIWLSFTNLLTSLYTALVIFCVLGYMGHKNYMQCIDNDLEKILSLYPEKFDSLTEVKGNITVDEYVYWVNHNFHLSEFPLMAEHSLRCNYEKIIEQAAEGSGLAFVVFTEAILQFPFPPLWSLLFFMMLMMLGLGSMFGTLEGVITSLNDSKIIRVEKPILTAVLCGSACIVGLVFTTHSGQYWVSFFDHFAGTYALMTVAFFEIFAVVYVYGWRRFCRDLEFMTGESIGRYWTFTWRFISPLIMLVIFTCSVVKSVTSVPKYLAYDPETTHNHYIPYPTWALFIAFGLVFTAMAPVPFVLFVRKFKIWKVEGDIPAFQANAFASLHHGGWPIIEIKASKCLGSTPSTTYMLKSQMSFNRMIESTASELQTVGLNSRHNIASFKQNGGDLTAGIEINKNTRNPLKYGDKSISNTKEKNSTENINSTSLSPITNLDNALRSAALIDRKKKLITNASGTIQNQSRNRRKSSTEK